MKTVLPFLLFLTVTTGTAQNRWQVRHNKKIIINTATEDTLQNRIILTHEDLKKWGCLWLTYRENPKRNDWKRNFAVYNGTAEWLQKSRNPFKIRNRAFRKLATQGTQLYIYTWSLPADPAVAATVRVRRVHLCTLILK